MEFSNILEEFFYRINGFIGKGQDVPLDTIKHIKNFISILDKSGESFSEDHRHALEKAINLLKDKDKNCIDKVFIPKYPWFESYKEKITVNQKVAIYTVLIMFIYILLIQLPILKLNVDTKFLGAIPVLFGSLAALLSFFRK